MLIWTIHFFQNKNIHIIIDSCYNVNPMGSQIVGIVYY